MGAAFHFQNRSFQKYISFHSNTILRQPLEIHFTDPHDQRACSKSSMRKSTYSRAIEQCSYGFQRGSLHLGFYTEE